MISRRAHFLRSCVRFEDRPDSFRVFGCPAWVREIGQVSELLLSAVGWRLRPTVLLLERLSINRRLQGYRDAANASR